MKLPRLLAVMFLIFGTSFFFLPQANAVQVMSDVTCAKPDGTQQIFHIGWDNSQSFFNGKGYIPRLFCEGGYAQSYTSYVSDNLTDPALGYYQGVVPVLSPEPLPSPQATSTPVETATPEVSPSPSQTPVETTTPPAVPSQSETVTASPEASPTETTTVQTSDTSTVVDTVTATTDTSTATGTSTPEPSPVPVTPPVTEPEPAVQPAPAPAPQPEPQPSVPEPQPVSEPQQAEPEPSVDPEPTQEESPAPQPEPQTEPSDESVHQEVPEPVSEPTQTSPVETSTPEPDPQTPPVEAVVPQASNAPINVNSVDLASLPPNTPVQLDNGVVVTAEVAIAVELLGNPAELLSTMFTDPGAALAALGNVGADLPPEVRKKAQAVVVSAVIAGNIATLSAGAAAGATYRRNK